MRPRNAAPGVRYRPAAELQPKPAGRNSGKRRVGALRALRRDYFTFMATRTGGNRSLKGERRFRRRGRRTWITKASALDGLNDEARAILMAIIETGAPCERDLQSRARSHLRRCGNPAHPHH
jgi:hypothetical protein